MEKNFNLKVHNIVEVTIVDPDWADSENLNGVLGRYLLVNPDEDKLKTLKQMIENRFDYQNDKTISNEEIEKAENFCDNIWDHIGVFIEENFISLDVDREFEIQY